MNAIEIFRRPTPCVDIGGTSTKAGVLDTTGELKFLGSIPSRPEAERYISAFLELIWQTRKIACEQLAQPPVEMGIGVADSWKTIELDLCTTRI